MLDLKPLLENSQFRQWFSHSMTQQLPEDRVAAEHHLKRLYDEIERWLQITIAPAGAGRTRYARLASDKLELVWPVPPSPSVSG